MVAKTNSQDKSENENKQADKADDANKEVETVKQNEAVNEAEELNDDFDENWRLKQLASDFAMALLQNPNIERYMTRPPLEDGFVQDKLTQGQWLARGCKKMAADFINELEKDSE